MYVIGLFAQVTCDSELILKSAQSVKLNKHLIDCISKSINNKYRHSCDLILSFLKVVFLKKKIREEKESFDLISQLKIYFREPAQFLSFLLATRS